MISRKLTYPLPILLVLLLFCSHAVNAQHSIRKFRVAEVNRSTLPLKDSLYKNVIEGKLCKKVYAFCAHEQTPRLVPANGNAFISCIHEAYDQHRPLVLSPDDIWLAICQGFSIHINENFRKYKSQLFVHDKPKTISIRSDSLLSRNEKGKYAAWKKLMHDFSDSVKFYCKQDLYALMVPEFSTTGPTEKTAYEITLLETTKKAFYYVEGSGCGIPEIGLKGTKADWQRLLSKLNGFKKYGLSNWVNNLKPVIQEFVNVYDGKVDKEFWNNLYKYTQNYNETAISGWVLKFFPYVKEYYFFDTNDKEGVPNQSFRYVRNKFMNGKEYTLSNLNNENLPSGFAKIESLWNITVPGMEDKKTMECYGGFLGIKQNKQSLELEPYIGWAVCEKMAKAVEPLYLFDEKDSLLVHRDLWLSSVRDSADVYPVYRPEKNKDFAEGLKELKETLKSEKKHTDVMKLEFIVSWSGDVVGIKNLSKNKLHKAEEEAVLQKLKKLSGKWSPALVKAEEFDSVDGKKRDYKVNFRINLEL